MGLPELTEAAVLAAIAEFDAIGRDEFLKKYGFGKSRTYFISRFGHPYDSKAIAGAAHGYVGKGMKALRASEFSGGDFTVAKRLRELGFSVSQPTDGSSEGMAHHARVRTWIFQCNPDQFDIDGYLASEPVRFVWLVTRYAEDMQPGDRVFIWRTGGEKGGGAGIIAEAEIIASPEPWAEEPEALPYWRTNLDKRNDIVPRARLRLLRVAGSREIIRRDWCREDPVLSDLPNLRMAAGTNYPIEPRQAERLAALWSRTGRDWTRNESVAGLWAYAQTYEHEVSRLPGSPVADVALALGRAVSGVYNKVMNFRAIDPRDQRAGMSGAGEMDRRVWREFYDTSNGDLRAAELEGEFNRLWRVAGETTAPPSDVSDQNGLLKDQVKTLTASGLEELLAKYNKELETRPARPNTKSTSTRAYDRSALVVAIAKLRADHRCEVPNCDHPMFMDGDDLPYTEVHHIEPLSEGGEDILENVACLCPAHHREVHIGRRASELVAALRAGRLR